ncbi:hypothetical protein H7F33_05790 [Pedobacter sp. PAMC26386]|nr:hypothetical protein H7F33_05790 [Pedobacter sp. PAMC26386]
MLTKSNMDDNYKYYRISHQILMTFKFNRSLLDLPSLCLDMHADYYRNQSGKLISYGHCINQQAICIVLQVECNMDFENIISNDPHLISGVLEIDVIVPFRSF